MNTRPFNGSATPVSEIGLGTWQLGGTEWGDITDEQALKVLSTSADAGVTFIDTADIYGMGRSESLIGRFLADRGDRDRFFIATKLGRHPEPGWPDNFTADVIRRHTENSLQRLGIDVIDLTQTHCIPHDVMKQPGVWDALRGLRDEGLIRHFGASVESMDEALTCLDVEGLASLQIIFNVFRQKPIDVLFEKAQQKNVAIIVRLALASGLLSGCITADTTFPENDHRNFNENGEHFNVGETFAGLGKNRGAKLADLLNPLLPSGMTMPQFALRWCLDYDAVTTVIPGATKPYQAADNAATSDLHPLMPEVHARLSEFYVTEVEPHIRGVY